MTEVPIDFCELKICCFV